MQSIPKTLVTFFGVAALLLACFCHAACSSDDPATFAPYFDCDDDGTRESSGACADESTLCQRTGGSNCCVAYCAEPQVIDGECEKVLGLVVSPLACASSHVILDCDGDGVPNHDDCAACDPTVFTLVHDLREDEDNDGYAQPPSAELMERLYSGCAGGSVAPIGFTWGSAPTDCNDWSPTTFRLVDIDADGDGWHLSRCIGAEDPPGLTTLPSQGDDCDDSDPTRQLELYGDNDNDGFISDGNSVKYCFNAAEPIPAGFVSYPGEDCDDSRSSVHPEQTDLQFDGVDSNCTSRDERSQCLSSDGTPIDVCNCWHTRVCAQPRTCADAPDIAITGVNSQEHCLGATGHFADVLVTNLGDVRFEGTLAIEQASCLSSSRWAATPLTLTMHPGEARMIEVNSDCTELEVAIMSGADCRSDNNKSSLAVRLLSCQ